MRRLSVLVYIVEFLLFLRYRRQRLVTQEAYFIWEHVILSISRDVYGMIVGGGRDTYFVR